MVGIYKITSPSGKIYIGQSIDIESRFKKYLNNNCKNQKRLYFSFKKHGPNNHIFEILCECEISELNDKERCYQDLYNSSGKKGLNCMLTKSNDRNGKHSEETILKFKNIRKNFSKETRIKMSEAQKGRKHTESTKLKMSQNMKGSVFSEETKRRMSESAKKKVFSEKLRAKNSTVVLDLNNGVFYNSITEASFYYGLKYSTLKAKLNNQNFNDTNLIKV